MPTTTATRPKPFPTPVEHRRRRGLFDLSATQLIATAFAAVTATVAGSYLGVSGTVLGAALASVVSAIGNAVYAQTLRRTRERVRASAPVTRIRPLPADTDHRPPVLPTSRPKPIEHRPLPWRAIAIGSVAVFAAVSAGVTVVELVAGRPLADLVRDDNGSGTSLFGDAGSTRRVTPTVPTHTVTVTPSIKVVTPTVTQTAPAATKTATPTTTVTVSPSASTSTSAPASASPTGSDTSTQLP